MRARALSLSLALFLSYSLISLALSLILPLCFSLSLYHASEVGLGAHFGSVYYQIQLLPTGICPGDCDTQV